MKISIVSINYAPEPTGIAVYSTGLAEYLAAKGHSVTIHTAFPYYPAWKKTKADAHRMFSSETINGVLVRRTYVYVPRQPTPITRILHELSFACSATIRFLFSQRSVLTIIVSPPLLVGTLIGIAAKLKRSKVVLHVQDLQPDAAIDLGMLKPGVLTSVLFAMERSTYALSERISTISSAMRERIEQKGIAQEKCLIFKNWANDDLVQPMNSPNSMKTGLNLQDRFVVLYSGNMGVKQNLGMLLDAAVTLRDDPRFTFLLVGDGGEKSALVSRAQRERLENVLFISPVPKEDLSKLLATADVSVISQKAGIDDLVLPSKLGNILASQRPVVASTSDDSELANIIKGSQCGIVIPPEDDAALVEALNALVSDPDLRENMAQNGRAYAMKHLRREVILGQFEQDLLSIASGQ